MNLRNVIEIQSYGTSEGVKKAWDTRGRGRKQPVKQSPDEIRSALNQAGTTKKVVQLKYNKDGVHVRAYQVQPYSFRPGGLFYGYDMKDGSIKAFRLDKIVQVKQTKLSFKPKWPIEVGGK